MKLTIAIQPDDGGRSTDRANCSSPRWAAEIERRGHSVRWVNVYRADILEQLRGCQALMWRWVHYGGMSQIAQALLPVVQRELGLAVFPDQHTCWHYDNKLAQGHLLSAANIPAPKTWIWFDEKVAHEWADTVAYPIVLKLAGGAGATNVRLVRSPREAQRWIRSLFKRGVVTLQSPLQHHARQLARAVLVRSGLRQRLPGDVRSWNRAKGYALFQEFLPDNAFDTRITVIGQRAFAFRRFNRPNDFRASGSGRVSYDPCEVDPRMLRLAFHTARSLQMQSCAIDGLYRSGEPVIGEVSYTYRSDTVYHCPGHWELVGDAADGELVWRVGQLWPEEAQVEVLLEQISQPGAKLFLPDANRLEYDIHRAAIQQVYAA